MDKYVYPAVFTPAEAHGYCVTFPDLPGCITEGDSLENAVLMAKEALALHLYGMEQDQDPIPEPTRPERIPVSQGAFLAVVEAWMPVIRDQMANRSVKKTLTIPKWLDDMAQKEQVNYSHILQAALKRHLGIGD